MSNEAALPPDSPFVPLPSDMAVDLLKEQERVEYALGKAKKDHLNDGTLDTGRIARLENHRAIIRRAYYAEWKVRQLDGSAEAEAAMDLAKELAEGAES